MIVLEGRNVQAILPRALKLLDDVGVKRESRNGPVLKAPCPVTTVYTHPKERVLFWKERDANPFFHLYEALWMLAGRDDVAGPARYAKQMLEYSDDGKRLHGAYGHRWTATFSDWDRYHLMNQLLYIASKLRANEDDRRAVLQMWDASRDLGRTGKDIPCNLIATFQRDDDGRLDLDVFCRSNDIIWGCYGANAVHFSVLQEYMATWIGCPVGKYRQISVNWHGYLNTLAQVANIPRTGIESINNPYLNAGDFVQTVGFSEDGVVLDGTPEERMKFINSQIRILLDLADHDFTAGSYFTDQPILLVAHKLLYAHHLWRTLSAPERYERALETLVGTEDWIVAGRQWMERRRAAWEAKMQGAGV